MSLFESEKVDSLHFLRFLLRRKWIILAVTLAGAVAAVVISLFIPAKYASYGIIFPPNANSGIDVLEDPRFGYGTDADQLMQLLESKPMMDTIITMYRLDEYYEVDKSEKSWYQQLVKKYLRDITYTKTRYFSIVINVRTKDPEMSADIVNSIIEQVDFMRSKLLRTNQKIMFEYAEQIYTTQKTKVDSLKNKIYALKKPDSSGDLLYNHVDIHKKEIVGYRDTYVDTKEMEDLVNEYDYESEVLKNAKTDYDMASRLIEKPLSKVYVVSKGSPNYKKVSPVIRINALIGLTSSFIFIILILYLLEKWDELESQLKSK